MSNAHITLANFIENKSAALTLCHINLRLLVNSIKCCKQHTGVFKLAKKVKNNNTLFTKKKSFWILTSILDKLTKLNENFSQHSS